jgi:hypothetical protein
MQFKPCPESAENGHGRGQVFFAGVTTFRSFRLISGRGQSGWKLERGRGTDPALIFGEKRLAEISNRADGAGLEW